MYKIPICASVQQSFVLIIQQALNMYCYSLQIVWQVLFRPQTIYETHFGNTTCGVDAILLGHTRQRTDQSDEFFPDSMRNHLFSPSPPQAPGTDLAAMDIQRGRDHGIAGVVHLS